MSIKKILVISDTHNYPRVIEKVMQQEKQVDMVLHLGDLEGHGKYIEKVCGCPLQAVRGNCDYDGEWPADTMVEIGGHMIFLTHGHRYGVNYSLYDVEDIARESGADIAMFGHTHVPYFERQKDGFVMLNPGSLGRPRQQDRKETYLIMEVDETTGEIEYSPKFVAR